jgi:hypothetical protein
MHTIFDWVIDMIKKIKIKIKCTTKIIGICQTQNNLDNLGWIQIVTETWVYTKRKCPLA